MEIRLDIKRLLILFFIVSIFCSCATTKVYEYDVVKYKEPPKEAVNIAIADYSKQLKRQKDLGNITAVNMCIIYTSTDWFYISMHPWTDEADKFPISLLKEYEGEIPPEWIPTEYVEKNNVLYVWHNPQMALTADFIDILKKYNLVPNSDYEWMATIGATTIHYIFCKTNYKKRYFRKVKTRYITPLPSCGCH